MIQTEEKIMIKAKKILADLQGEFYNEKNIDGVRFIEKDKIIIPRGKILSTWTVFIREPLFDSSIFLIISDETCEPLYIQNKHGIAEIEKNSEGKYF